MSDALSEVLEAQLADQRGRALRTLLRQPLLTSRGPDRQKFADVRKHAGWLAEWFGRETGWTVHVDHSVARLRKVAASHQDGTRSAQVSKQPFSRRRTCSSAWPSHARTGREPGDPRLAGRANRPARARGRACRDRHQLLAADQGGAQ